MDAAARHPVTKQITNINPAYAALTGYRAEDHGGRIWATGEIDQGATLFFTLGTSSLAARA